MERKGEGGLVLDMGGECDAVGSWITQHQMEIVHVDGEGVGGGGGVPAGAGEAFTVQKFAGERVHKGGVN